MDVLVSVEDWVFVCVSVDLVEVVRPRDYSRVYFVIFFFGFYFVERVFIYIFYYCELDLFLKGYLLRLVRAHSLSESDNSESDFEMLKEGIAFVAAKD